MARRSAVIVAAVGLLAGVQLAASFLGDQGPAVQRGLESLTSKERTQFYGLVNKMRQSSGDWPVRGARLCS